MNIVITRRHWADVPDGINIFIYSLAEALLQKGHRVTLLSGASCNIEKVRDYFHLATYPEILSLGTASDAGYLTVVRSWRNRGRAMIRDLDPDFIIVNGALPFRNSSLLQRYRTTGKRESGPVETDLELHTSGIATKKAILW